MKVLHEYLVKVKVETLNVHKDVQRNNRKQNKRMIGLILHLNAFNSDP